MKRHIVSSVAVALLLLTGVANTTRAVNIISFNLLTGTQNSMFPQDLAGAPGVRTTNWNQITSSTLSLGAGSIKNNSGALVLNMTMVLTPNASFLDRGAGVTNDNKMINTVIDKYNGSPGVLVVGNIPYALYNVYFYSRPDYPLPGNGLSATRGGYFTLTNSAGVVQRRYISTQDKTTAQALPMTVNSTDGSGYILANTTNIAPSGSFAQVDGGNYVEFTGLTAPNFTVLMSALGDGIADDAGNVITDGDTVRRLKWCGFQIEEVVSGVATNLSLVVPVPDLLPGNPAPFALQVMAYFDNGTSADVTAASGISYASGDTSVFTVSAGGAIQPLAAGSANLVVNFQSLSLTQAVTVLAPISLSPPTVVSSNLFVSGLGGGVTTAMLLATFNGQTNVDVTSFTGTTFSGGPAEVVTVTSGGTVTAVGAGSFSIVGNYGGLSATNNSAGTVTALASGNLQLASPDGSLVLSFAVANFDGSVNCPVYSVTRSNVTIIANSRLGLNLAGSLLQQNLAITSWTTNANDSTWQQVYGERSSIRDHYNELIVNLQETVGLGRQIQFDFRAYNEGVAFDYTIPVQPVLSLASNLLEVSEFRFASNYTAWSVGTAQGMYTQTNISGLTNGCERPLPIQLATNLYAALGEANLVNYSRMKFNQLGETNSLVSVLDSSVTNTLPVTSPWRYIMVATNAGELLENNYLILNLNAPCALTNTSWIRPGKCLRDVTLSTQGGEADVDFAVKHNLQYVEFDSGWYPTGDPTRVNPAKSLNVTNVVTYAAQYGIGIILYVDHNDMQNQEATLLPLYRSWGIKGVKVGFVNVGPQYWQAWLTQLARDCATNQLMLDVHDEYRVTGYCRTYPNWMTAEGVSGDEDNNTVSQDMVTLFSRMVAGQADHTICYFDSRVNQYWSHGIQLAKAVCFYSPWQFVYWYDQPTNSPGYVAGGNKMLMEVPELEFNDFVPTVWDETRVLQGSIGQYAVVARRSGTDWYIGAINSGQSRTFTLPLDFLTPGVPCTAHQYSDDSTVSTETHVRIDRFAVTSTNVLQWTLGSQNGQAMRITPTAPATFTSISRLGNSMVNLTAQGKDLQPYSLRASTDLSQPVQNWTVLTNGIFTTAPASFLDVTATNRPQMFYILTTP